MRTTCSLRFLSLTRFVWAAWLAILFARATSLVAADYEAGKTYFGRAGHIEYLAGDLPIIISAPHGGRDKPDDIPAREKGTFAFDVGTQELARIIAAEFHTLTGHHPHVIICRLHRTRVDCNREIVEAAAGHPLAERAWRDYQGFIDAAKAAVENQFGRGLFIDLHGHGHEFQRLEIGYLLDAKTLQLTDRELNTGDYAGRSSLRTIAARSPLPFSQLVRGPLSFGSLMEQNGFTSAPSEKTPHPPAPFFPGGYNTIRHARDAGPLAGLQIETNFKGVRDNNASRKKFAHALEKTLRVYLDTHLNLRLPMAAAAEVQQERSIECAAVAAVNEEVGHSICRERHRRRGCRR